MDRLELFTSNLCPFAMRVRLALAEKNVRATEVEIDLRNKPAWFLDISPQGKVPLLRHNGKLVWESSVICEYLEEAFPLRRLLPENAYERAETRIWSAFADARLYAKTFALFHSSDGTSRASLLVQLAEAVLELEHSGLGSTHRQGPYLLGSELSLADLALQPWFEQVCVLERYFGFQMPAERRQIDAWREAITARDAVRAIGKPPEFYLEAYGRLLAERGA